ncbi:hypothetical protein LMG24238_00489 [Paraburkholderia sediminicola]|uniref:Uncharacterized protein n=1 Tax=Paraburkholderia sediminicola TaxID=458836 RepID=A0A6J4ZU39_9BURK|nr:hypothetical protein [Paraburkholderia sediminicola]CAB3643359.1 hypothetical protein LMG24238_00489 [Paraburkholderia sediminicola]
MKHPLDLQLKVVLVGGVSGYGVAAYGIRPGGNDVWVADREAPCMPQERLLGVPNPVMMRWHADAAGWRDAGAPDFGRWIQQVCRACSSGRGERGSTNVAPRARQAARRVVLWDE